MGKKINTPFGEFDSGMPDINILPNLNLPTWDELNGTNGGSDPLGRSLSEANRNQTAAQNEEKKKQSIIEAQKKQAEQFAQNAPGLKEQSFNNVANQERRRLSSEISGIKSGSSSRGLLYSGLRKGSESSARADSQSTLAGQRQGINTTIDEAVQKYKDAPIGTGLNLAQMQSDISNQAMATAIKNMQERSSALGALGQAGGRAVGQYFGRPRERGEFD